VKRLLQLAFVVCSGIVSSACAQTGSSAQSSSVYTSDIQPIFAAKCASCHSGERKEAGLDLSSWDTLIQGSDNSEAIIAYDAANSVMMKMVSQLAAGSHPAEAGEAALTDAEVSKIMEWIDGGAVGPQGNAPFSGDREFVYITNQGEGTVNVVDVETNVIARRVDLTKLGFDVGSKPHHVAVEADGAHWYVTLISAGRILKFTRDNELVGQGVFEVPGLLELDPANPGRLYVGRSMAAVNPPQRIGMIETETMEIEEIEVFLHRPHALAVSQDGRYVYSASLSENRMIAVDMETGDSEFHTLDGPIHTLVDLQISPDGHTMVSGAQMTGKFFFFDAEDGSGVPIEKTIDVEAAPWHPVFNADGSRAYFANKMADAVTILNMETEEVEAVIKGNGLAQPHGTALSADGRYLYVSNQNMNMAYTRRHNFGGTEMMDNHPGTIVVIDTQSQEIIKVLEAGAMPAGTAGRALR